MTHATDAHVAPVAFAPHHVRSAATGAIVALALAPILPRDGEGGRAGALMEMGMHGAFPAALARTWVHRTRTDPAEATRRPRGVLWLEVDDAAVALDHPAVVRQLASMGDVGCPVDGDDLIGTRSALTAIAGSGVAFIVLESALTRRARRDMASAIMVRSITRRAHINGMAVVAQVTSGWQHALGAADLGIDLIVECASPPVIGMVRDEP